MRSPAVLSARRPGTRPRTCSRPRGAAGSTKQKPPSSATARGRSPPSGSGRPPRVSVWVFRRCLVTVPVTGNRMLTDVETLRGKAEPVVDQYSADDLQNAGRLKQIRMVAKLVNQQNKRALPIVFGAAAGIIVVFVLVGLLTGLTAFLIPVG